MNPFVVFVLIFPFLAIGLLLYGSHVQSRNTQNWEKNPETAWKEDFRWRKMPVRAVPGSGNAFLLLSGILLWLCAYYPLHLRASPGLIMLSIFFPVALSVFTYQWYRTQFTLDFTKPGERGGDFSGILKGPLTRFLSSTTEVRLVCYRVTSGKLPNYQSSFGEVREHSVVENELMIHMPVPAEAQMTGHDIGGRWMWKLEVRGMLPLTYRLTFQWCESPHSSRKTFRTKSIRKFTTELASQNDQCSEVRPDLLEQESY